MKKLKIALVMVSFFALTGFTKEVNQAEKYQSIQETRTLPSNDVTSPVISFKQSKDIVLIEGSKLNLADYIEATDNSGIVSVSSIGKFNGDEIGEYTINIIASDASSNISSDVLSVKVISKEDFFNLKDEKVQELIAADDTQREKLREEMRVMTNANSQEVYSEIEFLAESYIGMRGYCNEVADAFLEEYLGHDVNVFDTHSITKEEAKPGDLVEYADGGKGFWHVAVYLSNDMALHGNWNGTTVISSIWVQGATAPYFERLN